MNAKEEKYKEDHTHQHHSKAARLQGVNLEAAEEKVQLPQTCYFSVEMIKGSGMSFDMLGGKVLT